MTENVNPEAAFDELRQAVLPIIVLGADQKMICVGTAFVLQVAGKVALLCSAAHVLSVFGEVDRPYERDKTITLFSVKKPLVVLKDAKPYAIFYDRATGGHSALIGQTVPIELVDIGTCIAQFEPWVPKHLNFRAGLALDTSPVQVGDKIIAIGYPEMVFDGDPFADNALSGKLHFPRGTVTAVYPSLGPTGQKAPCFSVDIDLPHGMSGGPVMTRDADGTAYVRGVVRSDFKYADPDVIKGSALVTAIWPLLMLPFRPPNEVGEIDWTQSLMELERRGKIVDKSRGHQRIDIRRDASGRLIDAKYRNGDGLVISEIMQPKDTF